MARTIRDAALGYLRDGKVVVHVAADRKPAQRRAPSIRADVFGRTRYVVGHELDRGWWCSCTRPERPCRHMAAVQLVTGYPSAAAKPGPGEPADTAADDMDLDALLSMRAQAGPGGE
jgi:hypothetical protein